MAGCVGSIQPPSLDVHEKVFLDLPGPTSPGIAIDVYLQPLVEELIELWDVGVESFNASSNTRFQLCAVDHK